MERIALIVFCVLVVLGMIAAELLFCRDPKTKEPHSDDKVNEDKKD